MIKLQTLFLQFEIQFIIFSFYQIKGNLIIELEVSFKKLNYSQHENLRKQVAPFWTQHQQHRLLSARIKICSLQFQSQLVYF